ncbi:MAG: hypothetical protein CM15mV28_0540 [Thaumasvirus sp.]|nr:MAG: hypothetical protein CM15mV28_0540 [Thaumasvirus sp.]
MSVVTSLALTTSPFLKNPSTVLTVIWLVPRAVITPVVPEVAPVTVAPTSIVVMSVRVRVAFVATVATLTVAPFP